MTGARLATITVSMFGTLALVYLLMRPVPEPAQPRSLGVEGAEGGEVPSDIARNPEAATQYVQVELCQANCAQTATRCRAGALDESLVPLCNTQEAGCRASCDRMAADARSKRR